MHSEITHITRKAGGTATPRHPKKHIQRSAADIITAIAIKILIRDYLKGERNVCM